ncbi:MULTISPECIES: head-tail connector protein [unclassified Campylobacter]|uniref:head-tail connector protein n=1 Tax=unclassified Campylobacter TaxID=2593542 RepID=UPI001473D556|nr:MULTISPECIES: head-tail connector protein [unclassified Campylobacter]
MIELSEAREWLRLDGEDNDEIIKGLLDAIPSYIEVSTGLNKEAQDNEPLAKQLSKFILILWYNAEQSEGEKLSKVIDNLMKALSTKANSR